MSNVYSSAAVNMCMIAWEFLRGPFLFLQNIFITICNNWQNVDNGKHPSFCTHTTSASWYHLHTVMQQALFKLNWFIISKLNKVGALTGLFNTLLAFNGSDYRIVKFHSLQIKSYYMLKTVIKPKRLPWHLPVDLIHSKWIQEGELRPYFLCPSSSCELSEPMLKSWF